MSQLNAVALFAQVITAWVALYLLWQTWRDKRRDQAARVMVAVETDQHSSQSLVVLNEGDRTIKLNAMYQLPIGPKGVPDSSEVIMTYLGNPLLAPNARESIPLDSKWDFTAANDVGDPTEAQALLSIIDTRNTEWILTPQQRKPVRGIFLMRGMKAIKIMPARGEVIIRNHPDRTSMSTPDTADGTGPTD